MTTDRLLFPAFAVLAILALMTTAGILAVKLTEDETLAGPGLIVMPADLGGPFDLTSHDGDQVSEAAFAHRPTLVYFGYTYCPDICPMTLQTMAAAMAESGGDAAINAAFITVDPERDTADHLADYVTLFDDGLVGLTGSADQIQSVAKAFRVYFRHRKDVDPAAYPVDHSSYIYLMDHNWRLAAVFRHDASVEEVKAAIRRFL